MDKPTIKLTRLAWCHEDDLPKMADETFKKLLPLSRDGGTGRLFPFVNIGGENIYLTTLFPAELPNG